MNPPEIDWAADLDALFGAPPAPEVLPQQPIVCSSCGETFTRTEAGAGMLLRPDACASCWFRKKGTRP